MATTLNNLKFYLKKTSTCEIHPEQPKVLFKKYQLVKKVATTLNNLKFYLEKSACEKIVFWVLQSQTRPSPWSRQSIPSPQSEVYSSQLLKKGWLNNLPNARKQQECLGRDIGSEYKFTVSIMMEIMVKIGEIWWKLGA